MAVVSYNSCITIKLTDWNSHMVRHFAGALSKMQEGWIYLSTISVSTVNQGLSLYREDQDTPRERWSEGRYAGAGIGIDPHPRWEIHHQRLLMNVNEGLRFPCLVHVHNYQIAKYIIDLALVYFFRNGGIPRLLHHGDAHGRLLKKVQSIIFYNSRITENWYKNQPSKTKHTMTTD